MQRRSSAVQWRNWLAEFEESNLTIAKFCDSVGTSVASFYKWRHGWKVEALGTTGLIGVERRQRHRFAPPTAGTAGRIRIATTFGLTHGVQAYLCTTRTDSRLYESNGRCVRSPLAEKNWLFVGSHRAGARAAVLASQVASCKNNLVEPWAYLKNVYTRLADDPTGDQLTELPPDIWLNKNPTQRWEIAEKRKTERDAKALSLVRLRLQRPRSDEFDRVMWQHLRNRQSCQQKFRVEHSLRIYVANFDRLAAKLNVEIDGPVHPSAGPRQYDSVRKQVDACLTAICRSSWALSNQSTLQYFLLESLNDRNLIQPWRCVGFVFIKGAGGTRKS